MNDAKYYLLLADGRTVGPFNLTQIKERLDSGEVTEETPCAAVGDSQWRPVRELPKPTATAPAASLPRAAIPISAPVEQPKTSTVGKVLGFGCLGIIGLFVLLAIIGGISGGGGSDLKFDAYYTATASFVPAHLKAPSTAKFAAYGESGVSVDGDVYTVTGWVDAQNSFGAMVRQRYICKMRWEQARGKWVHIDTSLF